MSEPISTRFADMSLEPVPLSSPSRYCVGRWSVVDRSRRVQAPLFLAHGEDNRTHSPEQAELLRSAYAGPVDMTWLPNAGHTEWMTDDDPAFIALSESIVR
jgi:pimeloyl-ACP methyl ester carboxylesterase